MPPAPAVAFPRRRTPVPLRRAAGSHMSPAPHLAHSHVAVGHTTALNRKVKTMKRNTNQHLDLAPAPEHAEACIESEVVIFEHPDRGDVPGWVMLTLMSAVLVAGLLLIAQPALEGLFNDAISRVTGQ